MKACLCSTRLFCPREITIGLMRRFIFTSPRGFLEVINIYWYHVVYFYANYCHYYFDKENNIECPLGIKYFYYYQISFSILVSIYSLLIMRLFDIPSTLVDIFMLSGYCHLVEIAGDKYLLGLH